MSGELVAFVHVAKLIKSNIVIIVHGSGITSNYSHLMWEGFAFVVELRMTFDIL